MDWNHNTFYNYGLNMVVWFMETLPGLDLEQAVVCNDNNTISGFII